MTESPVSHSDGIGGLDAPRSVADLVDGIEQGHRYRYVFFWGHTPRRPGEVDASCFSQWYPAPFSVDGVTYLTAEHWMMAGKARLFGDESALAAVLAATHPGEAKSAGRTVRDFDDLRWNEQRMNLVVDGSIHKFTAHPELRAYLVGTGTRVLVEASPADSIWGTGLTATDPRSEDPSQWPGSNLLGFALMAAREHLGQAGHSTSTSVSAS